MKPLPSPEQLRALLDYDQDTGVLTWKPRTRGWRPNWWNAMYAGTVAGTVTPGGPVAIKIHDQNYMAHRVIWAMVHGTWPECVIHRNRKLADNRLKNLRDMSRKAVQRRPVIYRTNTSGVRGVSWNRKSQKWGASIRVADVQINLGSYATKEEAAKARRAGERRRDRQGL